MGIDLTVPQAFAKAQEAAGFALDREGAVLVTCQGAEAAPVISFARRLRQQGYEIFAPQAIASALEAEGIELARVIERQGEGPSGSEPSFDPREIRVILNPDADSDSHSGSSQLRRFALKHDVPCFTTLRSCELAVAALADGASVPAIRPALQTLYA